MAAHVTVHQCNQCNGAGTVDEQPILKGSQRNQAERIEQGRQASLEYMVKINSRPFPLCPGWQERIKAIKVGQRIVNSSKSADRDANIMIRYALRKQCVTEQHQSDWAAHYLHKYIIQWHQKWSIATVLYQVLSGLAGAAAIVRNRCGA